MYVYRTRGDGRRREEGDETDSRGDVYSERRARGEEGRRIRETGPDLSSLWEKLGDCCRIPATNDALTPKWLAYRLHPLPRAR